MGNKWCLKENAFMVRTDVGSKNNEFITYSHEKINVNKERYLLTRTYCTDRVNEGQTDTYRSFTPDKMDI